MKWLLSILLAGSVSAATINVLVYGSRDVRVVDLGWDGTKYNPVTNYHYSLTAQIPTRPNGAWLGWEKTWETNALPAKLTWNIVSNRVARFVAKEMLDAGISTNGHTILVKRGKRVTQ